ncbi:MAG: hypothetical protein DWI09_09215 [Planctomycetota bacterium]|nr:MAG: hypothetical protein DWI09_09215 [Planctomycetota bacterium]
MTVDEVLHRIRRLGGIHGAQRGQTGIELADADFCLRITNPREQRVGKRIVHRRIEGRPIEPRVGAIPNFANDVGVGVDRLHQSAPCTPKTLGNLVGHIEPPSIDAVRWIAIAVGIHPATGDVDDVLLRRCAGDALGILAKLGQFAESRPAAVLERLKAFKHKPIGVARLRALGLHLEERLVAITNMIEHAVKNHAQSLRLQLRQHSKKRAIACVEAPCRGIEQILVRSGDGAIDAGAVENGAEVVVDVHIGRRVVLVRAGRFEHGIQVDRVHTELLEIRNSCAQPVKIATILAMKHGKLPECRAVLRLPPTHLAPSALPRTGVDRIVVGIAVGKAVEHDLVPDRIFRPIGSVKSIDTTHRLRHHRIAADQQD